MNQTKNYSTALGTLISLFFMWGFITVFVDPLIPRLKEVFELTYFQAGLIQFAFFGAYFMVSIPAAFLISRVGYKRGIIIGLGTMACGCLLFYPAAGIRVFGLFLSACFVLAGGMALLQVAANPFVAALGPERTASSRLNLAQAFNSLGTAIAPLLGAAFLLSDSLKSGTEITGLSESDKEIYLAAEASSVQGPFVILAVSLLALALIISFIKLPKILEQSTEGTFKGLSKFPHLWLGAIGIFLYVGAEVAIGSYLVNYFMDMGLVEQIKNNPTMRSIVQVIPGSGDLSEMDAKQIVGTFVFFYWTGAMIGRFIGSYLTRIMVPQSVLRLFAGLAITFIIISMTSNGFVAMWSILAVGLFNSIMFPTIFTMAIDGLGEHKPEGSGILCTAIVGGAFIPPAYGFLTDNYGFKLAFILVILCYGYIFYFGYKGYKVGRLKLEE